jgi:4-amino-4-deoxy-L-arabinose transferase-like glycosyltransferase
MARKKRGPTSATQPMTAPPAPIKGLVPWFEAHALLLIAIACAALLLPFIDKAFHIDDPLFIWAAQHIASAPADFYGFDVDWYGSTARMYDVMQNPPLTSYYLAAASVILGWSEAAMHFAMLLPALAVVLGTWQIARRLVDSPVLAALITLASPVFLVSSTSVMSDVPMLACYVWAIALWMRGLDEKRNDLLWYAAIAASAAGLFKYFGISLLPLLLAYGLLKRRSVGTWMVPLALPVLVFFGFDAITASMFGKGHLTAAMSYAGNEKPPHEGANQITRVLLTLGFTGGCAIASLIFTPFLVRKRWWLAPAILGIATAAIFATGAIRIYGFQGSAGVDVSRLIQFVLFVAAGIGVFVLATAEVMRRRDAESVLMLLWVAGTFAFADYFNWTVAGRSLLPLAVPVAILIVSRMELLKTSSLAVVSALVACAVVSLLVATADYRLAGASREAAREIGTKYAGDGHRIWFEGHWGFQYYMQRNGGWPADLQQTVHRKDLWIVPSNNSKPFDNKPPNYELETVTIPIGIPIATMHPVANAGFYSDFKGALPFAIGAVPPEEFRVLRLGRPENP